MLVTGERGHAYQGGEGVITLLGRFSNYLEGRQRTLSQNENLRGLASKY